MRELLFTFFYPNSSLHGLTNLRFRFGICASHFTGKQPYIASGASVYKFVAQSIFRSRSFWYGICIVFRVLYFFLQNFQCSRSCRSQLTTRKRMNFFFHRAKTKILEFNSLITLLLARKKGQKVKDRSNFTQFQILTKVKLWYICISLKIIYVILNCYV